MSLPGERTRHSAAHAAREPHHGPAPIAHARDAVQRALDTSAVVTTKFTHRLHRGLGHAVEEVWYKG